MHNRIQNNLEDIFTHVNPNKGISKVIATLPSGYILCSTYHRPHRVEISTSPSETWRTFYQCYYTERQEALEAINPTTGHSIEIHVIDGYRGSPYRPWDSLEVLSVCKNGNIHYQRTYHPGMSLPGPTHTPNSIEKFTASDPGPKKHKESGLFKKEAYQTKDELLDLIGSRAIEIQKLQKKVIQAEKEESEGYIYQSSSIAKPG